MLEELYNIEDEFQPYEAIWSIRDLSEDKKLLSTARDCQGLSKEIYNLSLNGLSTCENQVSSSPVFSTQPITTQCMYSTIRFHLDVYRNARVSHNSQLF